MREAALIKRLHYTADFETCSDGGMEPFMYSFSEYLDTHSGPGLVTVATVYQPFLYIWLRAESFPPNSTLT